jgi:hypothetical protein
MKGSRILLLGVYGMELVEVGGTLAQNAMEGGLSHAGIMLSNQPMQSQLKPCAELLKVGLDFFEFSAHSLLPNQEHLVKIVRLIRKIKPDLIITQDPEHCWSDLDPGRRMAMIIILDGISLAAREFAVEDLTDRSSHPIPTIYYMTPAKPDCLVDISDSWDLKMQAMGMLEEQLCFSARHFQTYYGSRIMEKIVPGWADLESELERGRRAKLEMDRAFHLYHGASGHGHFAFSEPFRREGLYHFRELLV